MTINQLVYELQDAPPKWLLARLDSRFDAPLTMRLRDQLHFQLNNQLWHRLHDQLARLRERRPAAEGSGI